MNDRLPLHLIYPISSSIVVRKNLKAVLILLILALLGGGVFAWLQESPEGISGGIEQLFIFKKAALLGIVFTVVLGRVLYYLAYWRRYYFYLSGTRLFIESGVFVRKEASVPLTFLSEFYLEQDWFDLVAGTRTLVLRTATGEGHEVARIAALKHENAAALRNQPIKLAAANTPGYLSAELRSAA